MSWTTREIRGVAIVDLEGDLVADRPPLPDIVRELRVRGYKRFLVNLKNVTNIDVDAAGDLPASRWIACLGQGDLKLLNASKEHISLIWAAHDDRQARIEKTGIRDRPVDQVSGSYYFELETYSDEAEAVVSFDCLAWEALRAWAQKGLDAEDSSLIARHLPDCSWCRERLQIIESAEGAAERLAEGSAGGRANGSAEESPEGPEEGSAPPPPLQTSSRGAVHVRGERVQIVSVTAEQIRYQNEKGEDEVVDLRECNRGWLTRLRQSGGRKGLRVVDGAGESTSEWDHHMVGVRDLLDDPPWVCLFDERKTVFAFASYEASYELLLWPLEEHGWVTLDYG